MFGKYYYLFSRLHILPFIVALFLAGALQAEGHPEKGTSYGEHGIDTYATTRHGVDGKLFLDPYFLPYLKECEGQILLDAGCGAGPWAIYAADHGAMVYGIDIQKNMIEKAKLAALEANVDDKAKFEVGDVGNLPYPNDFFDKAISLNVGCNLPSLESHIKELKRVLKKGGSALITTPSSYGVVFTNGTQSNEKVIENIRGLLSSNHHDKLPLAIEELDEVYRATFAKREGKWKLIQDEKELVRGEAIWRKIPKMIVPNHYHSEQEYLSLFESEGFVLKHVIHPKFLNEQERLENNVNKEETLGTSYVSSSPFIIFIIEKR